MRCDVVRRTIEEGTEIPAKAQSHLAGCSACTEYIRRWELLRSGFMMLSKEEPPEASLGFVERLLRRLELVRANSQAGQQFIVQAGRRVVYATLFVAVILILALVLPSSGPVRTPLAAESILSQPQLATLPPDQIIGISDASYEPYVPESQVLEMERESK